MTVPFRYSLRSLAIVTTLATVALAWFFRPAGDLPRRTGRELDVAIFGAGLFIVQNQSGWPFYSRSGRVSIDSNGMLCLGRPEDGWELDPGISVPSEWTSIRITPDGSVSARLGNQTASTELGRIQLAKFVNPESLIEVAPGIYAGTGSSGPPTICNPGEGGTGFLKQGWLEGNQQWRVDWQSALVPILIAISAWTLLEVRRLHGRLDRLAKE